MSILQYYTYKDEYGRDISINETMEKIKFIMTKYRKELILKLLSHIGMKDSLENTPENIQLELLGLSFDKYKIIHQRAILVSYQFFYEIENYNENDSSELLECIDVFHLFILTNQLLNKAEYKSHNHKKGEVPIEILMTMMKMSVDFIDYDDIIIQNELFISFYEQLSSSIEAKNFDKILFDNTGLNLRDFIGILKKLKTLKRLTKKNYSKD